MRIHVGFCIALLGCVGGSGGGDDGEGEPDAAPSAKCVEATQHDDLRWIEQNVFTSCTFSACHQGAATDAHGLNLEPGMSHAELVNHAAVEQPGMMLVVPGQPNQSYLLVAIGHIPGTLPEDGMMPLNSAKLCGEKREAIERWIAAGAQP
jgi:hypothetical protein